MLAPSALAASSGVLYFLGFVGFEQAYLSWICLVPVLLAVRDLRPRRALLYGVVFASHQVGAFLGAWGGGLAFDLLGSYDSVWLASIALALFATLIHLPIKDEPLARLAAAPA